MMVFFRALFLFMFAFGVSATTKYYGMAQWIENNTWLALPLMVLGGIGIVLFFRNED